MLHVSYLHCIEGKREEESREWESRGEESRGEERRGKGVSTMLCGNAQHCTEWSTALQLGDEKH
jgi:hypothetical protein